MSDILTLSNISKEFIFANEKLEILKNISFSLKSGDSVAITGPSGSGKSTLLGIMAGLESPTSGEIYYLDQPIHNSSDDALCSWRRASVGFIFQNFRLIPHLKAIENVSFPLEVQGLTTHQAQPKAKEILEKLGLGHRLHHFPHQLSGGEKQRVAIARAYIHNPKIIFADEPTGNLDTASANKVLESLLLINQSANTTLVVVTHDLEMAGRLSSHFQLHAGEIVDE